MKIIILLGCIMICMFLLDLAWLGIIAKKVYNDELHGLLRTAHGASSFILWAAFIVYFLIAVGILIFVLPSANAHWWLAVSKGALFGFVIYGVYNFTNHALLIKWPLYIAIIDILWGTCLCAISSVIAWLLKNHLLS